jgi:hypothetical protein
MDTVISLIGMVKVSPIPTALAVIVPEARNVPDVRADQMLTKE